MSIAAQAPAPARATNTVTLGWGLVSIPLSVYSGTEATRVARKEFYKGNQEIAVGRSPVRKDTGAVIDTDEVVRMAQATSGTWVTLSDEEIAAATTRKGVADIECFVPLDALGTVYLTENANQVRPKADKGKPNPAAERSFSLLLAAMADAEVGALVKLAMRGPARYFVLTPEGELLAIYTADAVRQPRPLADSPVSQAERDLALNLIDAVGIETPVLTDDTAEAIQRYVDAKAAGQPAPEPPTAPDATTDLMGALEASLSATVKSKKNKSKKGKAA